MNSIKLFCENNAPRPGTIGHTCRIILCDKYINWRASNFEIMQQISLLGFDIIDIRNGRTMTKGEFFRKHTDIAESLAQGAEMPQHFVITPRPPFTPYVVRNGKIKEKS